MISLSVEILDDYAATLAQYCGENALSSDIEAANALLNEALRKLFFTYRSRMPAPIKVKRPVGRPPLDPLVKQCRRLYAELSDVFFELRMASKPEIFQKLYASQQAQAEEFYQAMDLEGLVAMAKERPWSVNKSI